MWDKLFESADLLQKGLEASWTRNAVIRNNIANAETPNFKASDVEFETVFADALGVGGIARNTTDERHYGGGRSLSRVEPVITKNDDTFMRMDGNNVDIESENVKLAQNSIQYNTILAKLNSELSRIRLAITEGR